MRTAVLVLALVPLLAGCGLECNFMYAPGGATVELVADSWPPGTYTVEVVGESCDFVLPDPDDGTTNYCDSPLHIQPTADGQGLEQLWFLMDPPETFEVVLSLDGVEFQRSTVAPVYTVGEPNGPGCGEASFGDATLVVDAG